MSKSFAIPATMEIATKFGARTINLHDTADVSIVRAIRIGITNILRDSYASDKNDDDRKASMETALAHFIAGTSPERGRTSDPVGAIVKDLVETELKQHAKTNPAVATVLKDKEKAKELRAKYAAKHADRLRKEAEKMLANAAKNAGDIDIDDLLG